MVCGQTRGDPDPRGTDPMEDRTNFFIGWGTLSLINAGFGAPLRGSVIGGWEYWLAGLSSRGLSDSVW